MDSTDFVLNGKKYTLAHTAVIRAVAELEPKPLQRWGVEVMGRIFPVKQAFGETLGLQRDFNSSLAREKLKRVGLRVIDGDHEPLQPLDAVPGSPTPPNSQSPALTGPWDTNQPASITARLHALTAAVSLHAVRRDSDIADVLTTADRIAAWLTSATGG
jgi:hypothetical protein